jgi:hypothetical protein
MAPLWFGLGGVKGADKWRPNQHDIQTAIEKIIL